jgi:hypothetical protein
MATRGDRENIPKHSRPLWSLLRAARRFAPGQLSLPTAAFPACRNCEDHSPAPLLELVNGPRPIDRSALRRAVRDYSGMVWRPAAAWVLLKAFCSEFGLSPVSRTRLAIEKPTTGEADLVALLSQPRERRTPRADPPEELIQ